MIINKNHSKIIKYKNECVEVIIYNIALKRVVEYFGWKMMLTVKTHSKLKREQFHAYSGKLATHSLHAKYLDPNHTMLYIYKDKNLDPHAQKIYDKDENSFRK